MSDFEYLQKVSFGQYFPLDSWVHKRDPRMKLVGFSFLIIALTLSIQIWGLLFGTGIVLLLMIISRTPWRYVLKGLSTPLLFLLILAIIQIFISPHPNNALPYARIIGFSLYAEGFMAGIRLLVRFCSLIILLTISSATLSTLEMIHGLELLLKPFRNIGLQSGNLAMIVQITMRFIPFLAINAEKIAKAQASRGAEWGVKRGNLLKRVGQVFPLIIPLFNNSLQQAETLADAMLARGYAGNTKRTSMIEYRINLEDWAFLLVMAIISLIILLIK